MNDDLVQGGQGREPEEVVESAETIWLVLGIGLVLMALVKLIGG